MAQNAETVVTSILREGPPTAWWAALINKMLVEKLISGNMLTTMAHRDVLRVFWLAVLEDRIRDAATYILNPWQTWFLDAGAESKAAAVDEDRLRTLVESGAAAFEDKPPEDFAALSAILSLPGSPPVTWPMLRTWLYSLTTVTFLQDYLERHHVPFNDAEPWRRLWVKFCFLIRKRINSRHDLVFLGVDAEVEAEARKNLNLNINSAFLLWLDKANEDAGFRPYLHGDPATIRPLDEELEHGKIVLFLRGRKHGRADASADASADTSADLKKQRELESWLDDYFLVSWLSQHTQRPEADLWLLNHTVLYAMYVDLVSCSDATDYLVHHIINEAELERMTRWLGQDPQAPAIGPEQIVQQFCQIERSLEAQLSQGSFSGLNRFREAILNFARFHYVTLDPKHMSDADLQHLANKLAQRTFLGMSRALAHSVINRVIEEKLSARDFLDIATERSLPAADLATARNLVLESNTRRLQFFVKLATDWLPDKNLAKASQQLDLVWDRRLTGRELGDSLMRQYLRLLDIYTNMGRPDEQVIDLATRDFVLKYQYQV